MVGWKDDRWDDQWWVIERENGDVEEKKQIQKGWKIEFYNKPEAVPYAGTYSMLPSRYYMYVMTQVRTGRPQPCCWRLLLVATLGT